MKLRVGLVPERLVLLRGDLVGLSESLIGSALLLGPFRLLYRVPVGTHQEFLGLVHLLDFCMKAAY